MSTDKRDPQVAIPITELSGLPDIRPQLILWADYPIEGLAKCSYSPHCTTEPQPDCRVTMQTHTLHPVGHLYTRCEKHQAHWEAVRPAEKTP